MSREKFRGRATRWTSQATVSRCWKLTRGKCCGSESASGLRQAFPPSRATVAASSTLRLFFGVFVGFVHCLALLACLVRAQTFELEMPIQLAHSLRIIAPIWRYFHEHAEENPGAEEVFQFFAGFRADFLHHRAFVADENFLLGVALDVESDFDAHQPGSDFELVDKDGDRVRKFVMHGLDGFFANDFGGEKALRLVGDLVFREIRLAFGKIAEKFVEKGIAA